MLRAFDGLARRQKYPAPILELLVRWLNVLALCLLLLGSATSLEDSPVSAPACSYGVCVINVIGRSLIVTPCEGYSVLVAYSQSSPATLIQCSKPLHEDENKLLVYDRKSAGAKSFVIEGARFLRPDALQTLKDEGIASSFGEVKLCAESQGARSEAGDLLIAEKRPDNSGASPYCYRINYVRFKDRAVQFLGSNESAQPPTSAAETKRWARLRTTLAPYLKFNVARPPRA